MAKPSRKKAKATGQTGYRGRIVLISLLLLFYGGFLVARLMYLQLIQHEELVAQSEKQYLRTVEINTGRGNILDRNGIPLAINIDVESVYIHPRDIVDKKKTGQILARTLGLNYKKVAAKVASNRHFVWVKRKCDLDKAEKLKQLGLMGVGFVRESKRFYPKRQLAAGVIGFVGLDNQGLAGVEHYRHGVLKGTVKRQVVEKDARGRFLRTGHWEDAIPSRSRDVVLTLDEVIQFTTEQELKNQVEKYKARSGLAIVMDPRNGEILATATLPAFNPNHYSAYPREYWRNDAVSSAFEPGSIFKPIIGAAVLEEDVARPNDIFFCENGAFQLGGVTIGEAANHKFGWLTVKNIIAKSSNIGAIKMAQELGEKKFFEYVTNFGFGKKIGVDLPGEATGKLRPLSEWSGLSLASISFGHEISATPIQMVSAISAIANGGTLIRPHVTKAILKEGYPSEVIQPDRMRRVVSERASEKLTEILKTAVESGTGRKAAVKGFQVAGKTGTAQKIDPNTLSYSKTDYIASFVGFVPADSPRLAILVMIDEPQKSYWGGEVAAPVFREIARKTLRYLNIPSSEEQILVLDHA